ncbi:MAG TPA: hypothetical protein EYH31_02130 [Anaerolineae bacterium]|nr:hypothetical protein [Anaerolineae bacterium]
MAYRVIIVGNDRIAQLTARLLAKALELSGGVACWKGSRLSALPHWNGETKDNGTSDTVQPADVAFVFEGQALRQAEEQLKPGSLLLIDNSVVQQPVSRDDLVAMCLPASQIARELGDLRLSVVVLLGALAETGQFVQMANLRQAVVELLPEEQTSLAEAALLRGAALADIVLPIPAQPVQ